MSEYANGTTANETVVYEITSEDLEALATSAANRAARPLVSGIDGLSQTVSTLPEISGKVDGLQDELGDVRGVLASGMADLNDTVANVDMNGTTVMLSDGQYAELRQYLAANLNTGVAVSAFLALILGAVVALSMVRHWGVR